MNNIITPTFGEEHITLSSHPFKPTPHLKTVSGHAMFLTIDGNNLPSIYADRHGVELDFGMLVYLPDGRQQRIADLRIQNGTPYAIFGEVFASKGYMVQCGDLAVTLDPDDPPIGLPPFPTPLSPEDGEIIIVDPDEDDPQVECYIAIQKGSRHRRIVQIFKSGHLTVLRGSFTPDQAELVLEAMVMAVEITGELSNGA